MLLNQTQPIEPLDMLELSQTKYETLTQLNSVFSSIVKNINTLENRFIALPFIMQQDREISLVNKQLIADEVSNRADQLPDHYLNELKTLLKA